MRDLNRSRAAVLEMELNDANTGLNTVAVRAVGGHGEVVGSYITAGSRRMHDEHPDSTRPIAGTAGTQANSVVGHIVVHIERAAAVIVSAITPILRIRCSRRFALAEIESRRRHKNLAARLNDSAQVLCCGRAS